MLDSLARMAACTTLSLASLLTTPAGFSRCHRLVHALSREVRVRLASFTRFGESLVVRRACLTHCVPHSEPPGSLFAGSHTCTPLSLAVAGAGANATRRGAFATTGRGA